MVVDAISRALEMSFRTALLLTGSAQDAEVAVMHAMDAWEGLSPRGLLMEVVKSAIGQRTRPSDGSVALLPPELRRLFILPPLHRECFVLRILAGLSPEVCAELLRISIAEFQDALRVALLELPLLSSRNEQPDKMGIR